MPELDAERREQLAEAFRGSTRNPEHLAFLVEPLVAGWLADAWDAGRDQGQWDGIAGHHNDNPYRGGDDG